jgi:Zn-dependent metalloprotease
MDQYGRNSINDNGMIIDSTVHHGTNFNNAFWNSEQMVYGDGDEQLFTRFTIDLDVIGHELTHGVTQYEAGLIYEFQSGALNESFSDVFGLLVKQKKLGQDAEAADWLIGANVLIGDNYALRSMKAPGTAYQDHPILGDDPQPATMDDYQDLPRWDDGGGVHLNSGIPNHAFYLAAREIGGNAWEKAGLIWYRALCDILNNNATFVKAAKATILAARQEFGRGSMEVTAVRNAWKTVKVL